MKAVRYYGRKDIRIEDVMEPDGFGPNQLLVKPLWTGICGTDLHEYMAGPIVTPATPHIFTAATLPQILGHEFSAEVLEVGKDVANLRRGDRVSIQPLIMPMNDYYSRRGLNHLSEKMGCVGLSSPGRQHRPDRRSRPNRRANDPVRPCCRRGQDLRFRAECHATTDDRELGHLRRSL